ncbi:MAG: hypothetical protein ACUVX9_18705, partial [Anaerolineae bacterium]
RKRVQEMGQRAEAEELAGLRRQVEAARLRLLRELGRTLRCLSPGPLDATFRQQVQREGSLDGRYHRALQLLGGYPHWTPEQVADAIGFHGALKQKDIAARIAGSEIDAAISDPRWAARSALG